MWQQKNIAFCPKSFWGFAQLKPVKNNKVSNEMRCYWNMIVGFPSFYQNNVCSSMTYKIQFFILAFVAENFPKNLQIFTLGSMFFTMFGIFFDKLPKFQYFANIFTWMFLRLIKNMEKRTIQEHLIHFSFENFRKSRMDEWGYNRVWITSSLHYLQESYCFHSFICYWLKNVKVATSFQAIKCIIRRNSWLIVTINSGIVSKILVF